MNVSTEPSPQSTSTTRAQGSRFFGTTHQYLDDDPSVASSDVYTVGVKVTDPAGAFTTSSAPITVHNVAPSNLQIAPMPPISEHGVGTLELAFDDPGSLDAHTVEVDWGDGSVEAFTLSPGARFFGTTHQYLDDDPSGTSADDYKVNVRVRDDDGGEATGSAQINVSNIAPSNLVVTPITDVDEHGFAQLTLSFDDPGTLDTHQVEVDWGDGTVEVLDVAPGARAFTALHQYLDDNPTGTSSDAYTVSVLLLDDDLGEIAAAPATVTVPNVAPAGIVIDPLAPIDENGVALLNLAFADPGPLDAHTVEIDWGDGSAVEMLAVPAGARVFAAASHQYLDDNPSDTPEDVYSISVKVRDDDGGVATAGAAVTVSNVPPRILLLPDDFASPEGSLIGLMAMFADHGSQDVHTYEIDWGDGSATSGAPAGMIVSASHIYADDGVYTVQMSIADDDGGVGVGTVIITVNNVAPTLQLTVDESLIDTIDEGGTTQVTITGLFRDPGFDNPLNTAGFPEGGSPETEESFEYEVDWGDGHTTGRMSLADLNGSPGVDSTGAIAQLFTHQYVDNDLDSVKDARYAVTVTVFDDDGGSHSQSFEMIAYNTNPVLQPIAATAVNRHGQTTLTLSFDDLGAPGVEKLDVLIDWGDNLPLADPLQRFEIETAYDGSTPQTFVFTHTYTGPPDPIHPAADIVITVKIRDDDFGTATSRPDANPLTINGQSNIQTVTITNPGLGAEPFRIDTTPQAPRLTFPDQTAPQPGAAGEQVRAAVATANDASGSAGDSRAVGERYLELRVINPDGTQSEGYRLRPEVLGNLQALFRNLPDNHYAIYLVRSESSVRRLVIDVFVRNGKVIDPGDDSEGARDRPPTEEAAEAAGAEAEVKPQPLSASDGTNDAGAWQCLRTAGHRRRRPPKI